MMDLERLIADKKREIETEKMQLGLSPNVNTDDAAKSIPNEDDEKNYLSHTLKCLDETIVRNRDLKNDDVDNHMEDKDQDKSGEDKEEELPPDLERYIRRYLGIPKMLKAGEFSPNNPILRAERIVGGGALLGLGEYERSRNTLRRIRQQQYKEYLDQQAKKKQEEKEKAERERREQEEREREREEREKERERLTAECVSPQLRRSSVCQTETCNKEACRKVDTGVQVNGASLPMSVGVQTDFDFYVYPPNKLTQAERELSPHTVLDERPAKSRNIWSEEKRISDNSDIKWDRVIHDTWKSNETNRISGSDNSDVKAKSDSYKSDILGYERRRSYAEFGERAKSDSKSTKEKLISDINHQYMPSIFDADAIQQRNKRAEEEAAARRLYYQQELKSQIQEQQRIKEERKNREKLLEQAEMRRLEEQLRMLKVAQDREVERQQIITANINRNTNEYKKKRAELQKEIDEEMKNITSRTRLASVIRKGQTQIRTEDDPPKLPFFYPKIQEKHDKHKKPFSTNIPNDSLFSTNYDVDKYLRKHLNPARDPEKENVENERRTDESIVANVTTKRDVEVEKSVFKDDIPIPVLRHSLKTTNIFEKSAKSDSSECLSDKMKLVEDKWKVPVVQKNILKTMPNEEGKKLNILTQLGSIRRQLQLEQLKLDMQAKN